MTDRPGRPLALVTGASAGIGVALARELARRGHDLILAARRRDRLEALAAELGPATRVVTADLATPDGAERLHAEAGPVDVLVNNAGLGAVGRFDTLPQDTQLGILAVNVTALTALTRLYVPEMVSRGSGRVLNVASTAAFQPGPGMAVYCASKAFVLSLSEALTAELRGTGVSVTCLCPGATESEFFEVAGFARSKVLRVMMSAEAVARLGVEATLSGRRLVVAGAANRAATVAVRLAPRGAVLAAARLVMKRLTS